MKLSQNTGAFFALLLAMLTFNAYSMDKPQESVEQPTLSNYIDYIAQILLGNLEFKQKDALFLKQLPPEDQTKIIGFLLINDNADSLEVIGKTINTLAHVSKELYQLINEPHFCLLLIKHLAQRFDCSNETVAMALQTEEAKNCLTIQKQFISLLCETLFNKENLNTFCTQHKNYINLNFTYKYSDNIDLKYTPLMCVVKTISDNEETKIKWLMDSGNVDINCSDKFGITPLMAGAAAAPPAIVELLCSYPTIKIDQKNKRGETALMILCNLSGTSRFNAENMNILINAGADPEITFNDRSTQLKTVEDYRNEEAINLIQEAIEKKHKRKSS